MKLFEIPGAIIQGAQNHPDGYVREVCRMTVEIANSLNREEKLHAELVQNERRETIETAPGEIAPENSQIAPPRDDCRNKLERIRGYIRGWANVTSGKPTITIRRGDLGEILRIIEE